MIGSSCRASHDSCRPLAFLALSSVLLVLLSAPAEALGRFGGGGAHFNVGSHFNAMRPIGGLGFRPDLRGPEFQGRFAGGRPLDRPLRPDDPAHPIRPYHPYQHYYPHYWPYAGPGHWAGAAAGAAAVGSWIYSLPPDCTSISIGGITYEQCGSAWYRPHYTGVHIAYESVAAPR